MRDCRLGGVAMLKKEPFRSCDGFERDRNTHLRVRPPTEVQQLQATVEAQMEGASRDGARAAVCQL